MCDRMVSKLFFCLIVVYGLTGSVDESPFGFGLFCGFGSKVMV